MIFLEEMRKRNVEIFLIFSVVPFSLGATEKQWETLFHRCTPQTIGSENYSFFLLSCFLFEEIINVNSRRIV